MKAIVTSIGEVTTDLCIWSLERQGFEVKLYKSDSNLWSKLKQIYFDTDDDFIRVDADVVVNQNIKNIHVPDDIWWVQFLTYDWFKQDTTHGGVQYISKQAIPALRAHIEDAKYRDRPETHMYRIEPFHNPRRCISQDVIMGLNGYKAKDVERVKKTKKDRLQDGYDWELAERLSAL